MKFFLYSAIILIFSTVAYSSTDTLEINEKQITEIQLPPNFFKPEKTNQNIFLPLKSNSLYDYIVYDDKVIINATNIKAKDTEYTFDFNKDNKSDLEFNLIPHEKWSFYKKYNGSSYAGKSGTALIHNLKITLPNCLLANVCEKNNRFRLKLLGLSQDEMLSAEFQLNGNDITNMLVFDNESKEYIVRRLSNEDLQQLFIESPNILNWKVRQSNGRLFNGEIEIIVGDKAVYGQLLDTKGNMVTSYDGRKVYLTHYGNDKIVTHTLEATVDNLGRYTVLNLPSFDYNVSIDGEPLLRTSLNKLVKDNGTDILFLAHTLGNIPEYKVKGLKQILSGEMIVFSLSDLYTANNKLFSEKSLTDLELISDINLKYKVNDNKIAIIFPNYTKHTGDIYFKGKGAINSFILKLPAMQNNIIENKAFDIGSIEGKYGKTSLIMPNGNIIGKKTSIQIYLRFDSIIKADKSSVKAFLYGKRNKDITNLFIWDVQEQQLTLRKEKQTDLFNMLDNQSATLMVAVCDPERIERCYRAYTVLYAGGASIKGSLITEKNSKLQGEIVTVRSVDYNRTNIVKSTLVDDKNSFMFNDLPAGQYYITLSDLDLRYRFEKIITITQEDVNKNRNIVFKAEVKKYTSDVSIFKYIKTGNTVLGRNNHIKIDLKQLDPIFNNKINQTNIIGELLLDYNVGWNNDLNITTNNQNTNEEITLIFSIDNTTVALPISYKGILPASVVESGADYNSCPPYDMNCLNAYVHIGGLVDGIYTGKYPLSITLPNRWDKGRLKIYLEPNADISSMFKQHYEKRLLTLSKDKIPALIGMLSGSQTPIIIDTGKTVYTLNITPGSKTIKTTLNDSMGRPSSLFNGLKVHVACLRGVDQWSFIEKVDWNGNALFYNLPDCTYSLSLIDNDGLFVGMLGDVTFPKGQNTINVNLPVSCSGDGYFFMNNCEPVIPIIKNNNIITPDVGLMFIRRLAPFKPDTVILPKDKKVNIRQVDDVLLSFFPNTTDKSTLKINFTKGSLSHTHSIQTLPIGKYNKRTLLSPKTKQNDTLIINGIDNNSILNETELLSFKLNSSFNYKESEISLTMLAGGKEIDLMPFFMWVEKEKKLTIKKSEIDSFSNLFGYSIQKLTLSFGTQGSNKQYIFVLYIGVKASDISGSVVVDDLGTKLKLPKDSAVLLIGREQVNMAEYRQIAKVNENNDFLLSNIPFGTYELVFIDPGFEYIGSTEITIQSEYSDYVVEFPVKKLAN